MSYFDNSFFKNRFFSHSFFKGREEGKHFIKEPKKKKRSKPKSKKD